MRKVFLYLLISTVSGYTAYSQDVQFGAQAGINFSGASAKNSDEKFKGTPLP